MDWDRIKSAIAQVLASGDENVTGTAFFIGGKFVLTALHVVAESSTNPPIFAKKISLKFTNHVTEATVFGECWNSAGDWVVLECKDPPNAPPIEMLNLPAKDAPWDSFGYPEIRPEGMTISGRVSDSAARFADTQAIQLFCKEAAAGLGARLHGFSGAPCIVDGRAVGILRATLVEKVIDGRDEWQVFTQAGTVYACPAKALIDFQIEKRRAILPGSWRPPERVLSDFLVFVSSSEGKYKKLEPVARLAHEKLADLIGAPRIVPIASLLESPAVFLASVEALCRAKVVVLDTTGFEPAIMLLAGIRSVVRRSVTILSVGHDYALGDPLNVPYNITDANLVAHSSNQSHRGTDPVDLLASRIRRGLKELLLSTYLDNPVYESIRRLPTTHRGIISKNDGVLVLCPFERGYNSEIWDERLRKGLKHQLDRLRGNKAPSGDDLGVARSFELNSPRLVTQALYEHIRRVQACVVDFTLWSENVLFEMGVRLAATGEGTACLLAKDWQPKFPEWKDQCEQIARLFVVKEGIYDPTKEWLDEPAYAAAYGPNSVLPFRGLADGSVHRAISDVLDVDSEPASRSVYEELIDSAELFGKVPGNSKPVGLYPGNSLLTAREESAEFDRLLTAWLFIYFRYQASERAANAELLEAVRHISITLMGNHFARINEMRTAAVGGLKDILEALAEAFYSSSPGLKFDDVETLKTTATAARNLGNFAQAIDILDKAISALEALTEQRHLDERQSRDVRAKLADTYGMKGGTYRRWEELPNHFDLALEQYRKGLAIESIDKQSTYNASNVITLSITQDKKPPDAQLLPEIDRVIADLKKETQGRRADEFWAWVDLGQFQLLRNDMDQALTSYERALKLGPTTEELRRHIVILQGLSGAMKVSAPELSLNIDTIVSNLQRWQAKLTEMVVG